MFFVSIYRFFEQHKFWLYALMLLSAALFVFFGLKVRYEEDMSKLLPSSEKEESGLVFGNVKVKDKIFMQMTGADPETLAGYVDELMDSILTEDDNIANTLYRFEPELAMNALDYAMRHVPSFVDTQLYARFDEAIAHAGESMAQNYELIMNDEMGGVTQMVATDPLNLRQFLIPDVSKGLGFALVNGHLFSHDSTVALMFISPDFQAFNSKSGRRLMAHLDQKIAEFQANHPGVEVLRHGAVVRSAGNSHVMQRDICLTVTVSLLIILLALCISFRSFSVVWQTVLPVFYGTFFALACMYWVKGGMSLMALGIGSVVLGVAISYCLHIVVHQRFVRSVEQVLAEEGKPICLGCLTTIGAFLGLLFTQSELLQDFGLFATFALIGSTFFTLFFLPHFLRDTDVKRNEFVFKSLVKINNFPFDRSPFCIASIVIVIIIGMAFTHKVQFDNDLKHIGYESDGLHRSENLFVEKNYRGGIQRYYAVVAPTLDQALDANISISSVLDSLQLEGMLNSYVPVVSTLFQSKEEQQRRINAWRNYWTSEKVSQAMTAVRIAAKENNLDPDIFVPFQAMLEEDYEPGNLYESDIVPEGLLCNFIEKSDGKFLIFNSAQMKPENKSIIDDQIVAMPHTVVVDPFYYTGNMITLVHRDFSTTLLISSLFVLVVLLLSFKDVIIALIAFMPMFLSWYVVQGWMAIFGLPFNLINIVISTFIFGIGVDYSIFVMQGLVSEQKCQNKSMLEFHKVAISFSAFVLIVAVLSMLFAVHPAIKSIGVSTLIGMASTIMITYTLQPLFFRWVMKWPFMQRRVGK